jgi:GAF domain-containing protein
MEAVDTTVDLREILYRLVEVTVATTGADRAVVLLLENGALVPTAVAGRRVNRELFRAFKQMSAIPVDEVEDRRRMVWGHDLVVIDDARSSPAVPQGWIDAFGTTSIVIAPLTSADGLAGILAVDHTAAHTFTDEELSVLRATAQAARVAIANAALRSRLARAADVQHLLVATIGAMDDEPDAASVLQTIAAAAASLFPGSSCAVSTVTDGLSSTSGLDGPATHRTAFPIRAGGVHLGFLTISGPAPVGPEDLVVVDALARHAALAIDRAQAMQRLREELDRTEVLHRLADVIAGAATLPATLRRLNDELCLRAGFACEEVALRERRDVELMDGRRVDQRDAALLARLATGPRDDAIVVDTKGLHVVPVHVNGTAAGLLYLRTSAGPMSLTNEQRALAGAVAGGIGEAVYRARLKRGLREANRRLELRRAREDVEDQLDERLARTLRRLDRGLQDELSTADGAARERLRHLRDLVATSLDDLHDAARAIGGLDVLGEGLEAALAAALQTFEASSGSATNLRVEGVRTSLPDVVNETLHAVAFDALSMIADAGRATTVTMTLSYDDPVVLTVRDDGIGLSQRGAHHAIAMMRARIAAVDGSLHLGAADPRGVRVVARLPLVRAVEVRGPSTGAVLPFRDR